MSSSPESSAAAPKPKKSVALSGIAAGLPRDFLGLSFGMESVQRTKKATKRPTFRLGQSRQHAKRNNRRN